MEESTPTISAIITTFNRKDYCREAIKSVLAQTYKNFELIILDNSSKDGTGEVVKSFQDACIRYICHPQLNVAQARNLGWRSARGAYVAFLDDDDLWLPKKLESQIGKFENGGTDLALVYGGFYKIDKDGKRIGEFQPTVRGMVLEKLLKQDDYFTGSASNPLIRRDIIEKLGGYDDIVTTGEDWEFYLRLAQNYSVECIKEPVLEIRQHEGPRLGDRLKEAAALEIQVMDRYKDIFDRDRKLRSFYLQKVGGKYCRIGEVRQGREYLRKAIWYNPTNVKVYAQYVLSFMKLSWYRNIHAVYLKKRKANKNI